MALLHVFGLDGTLLRGSGAAAELARAGGSARAAAAGAPWIDGVRDVWADIARRGDHSAVVTTGPSRFAELLLGWGVGSVHATHAPPAAPASLERRITPAVKPAIVESLMAELALGPEHVRVFGGSASDRALFAAFRATVAVNGVAEVEALARERYRGPDLRTAYLLGRRLSGG
ncbi:MAG: hypothetical protein AB7V42_15900 [Thermoleophilia bacterium]